MKTTRCLSAILCLLLLLVDVSNLSSAPVPFRQVHGNRAQDSVRLQAVKERLLPLPKVITINSRHHVSKDVAVTVYTVTDDALGLFNAPLEGFPNEGYKLDISSTGISITCASPTGEIRARQTLSQLLDTTGYPAVHIEDYPAFKVRGFMHDVGRSYLSIDELRHEIDLLARFKVSVFCWHLTDHHAFRFESLRHPQVNTAFTPTRWPGKYYTQEECRSLCQYAAERGIIVIPEIDMPGHSTSFTRAMGFTMSSQEGQVVVKDILTELCDVFAGSPYIHIGGDETSEATRTFINAMGDYVHSLGRKAVCWNRYGEAPRTLVDSAMHVDMLTNWATSGTLVKGFPNIDMRYLYANHFDVFADVAGIYRSTVFGQPRATADVAGAIVAFWNDRLIDNESQIIAENNLYATVLAIAERTWRGGGEQYIEQGGASIPVQGKEYEDFADWERRFLYYKDRWLSQEPIPYVRQCNLRWHISTPFDNGGDGIRSFPDIEDVNDLTTITDVTEVAGAGVWLNHIWGATVPGALGKGSSAPANQTRYAWTYVYSPKAQTVGAQIEFCNYSRSDIGRVPSDGQWDLMGSRVWLNDEELLPDGHWTNAGEQVTDTEEPLGNLNFAARTPQPVQLSAGWNKVLLKLPWVNAGQQRPAKWQYTFVLTTIDGRHEVPNLIYSPTRSGRPKVKVR